MGVRLSFAGCVSLDAAAATGAGDSFRVDGCRTFGLQVTLGAGNPATAVVKLEGTLGTDETDANNAWFTLATWDKTGNASGDIVFAVDKPVRKIRANCTTLDTGANKTATARLSAA